MERIPVAQQIADAAMAFHKRLTGHAPGSVSATINGNTLVVTLNKALSPAETALASTAKGAAHVEEYHRRLFASESESLRKEVKRITGVEVREAAAEIEPKTGTVIQVFTTGTMVQVFLLANDVPAATE